RRAPEVDGGVGDALFRALDELADALARGVGHLGEPLARAVGGFAGARRRHLCGVARELDTGLARLPELGGRLPPALDPFLPGVANLPSRGVDVFAHLGCVATNRTRVRPVRAAPARACASSRALPRAMLPCRLVRVSHEARRLQCPCPFGALRW